MRYFRRSARGAVCKCNVNAYSTRALRDAAAVAKRYHFWTKKAAEGEGGDGAQKYRYLIQGLIQTLLARFSQAAKSPASMRKGGMNLVPISAKTSVTKIRHDLATNYGAMEPGRRPFLRISSRAPQEGSLAQDTASSKPTPPSLLTPHRRQVSTRKSIWQQNLGPPLK